jgi:hypothetical protein
MGQNHFRRDPTILVLGCMAYMSTALAQASTTTQFQIQDIGVSGLWVSANVGLRACGRKTTGAFSGELWPSSSACPAGSYLSSPWLREATVPMASTYREGEGHNFTSQRAKLLDFVRWRPPLLRDIVVVFAQDVLRFCVRRVFGGIDNQAYFDRGIRAIVNCVDVSSAETQRQ